MPRSPPSTQCAPWPYEASAFGHNALTNESAQLIRTHVATLLAESRRAITPLAIEKMFARNQTRKSCAREGASSSDPGPVAASATESLGWCYVNQLCPMRTAQAAHGPLCKRHAATSMRAYEARSPHARRGAAQTQTQVCCHVEGGPASPHALLRRWPRRPGTRSKHTPRWRSQRRRLLRSSTTAGSRRQHRR